MGVIPIIEKPFLYLCLLRCYIQNNQTTLTDCINMVNKTVNEISLENEDQWYEKIGEVGNDLATFCLAVNKPIKGVSPLLKAIKLIQRGNKSIYTNLHTPILYLLLKANCFQHA